MRFFWNAISLLVLGLLAGIGWRAELELTTGWASLEWLNRFHWAVPISIVTFIAWVLAMAPVKRPILFASVLLGFAAAAYVFADILLSFFFAAGPSAMGYVVLLGGSDLDRGFALHRFLHFAAPCLWMLIPLAFCGICRLFGVKITLGSALSSAVLFLGSWPTAIFIRGFFEHQGSPDAIHALKSGFVIPLLIYSLGLPILKQRVVTKYGPPGSF